MIGGQRLQESPPEGKFERIAGVEIIRLQISSSFRFHVCALETKSPIELRTHWTSSSGWRYAHESRVFDPVDLYPKLRPSTTSFRAEAIGQVALHRVHIQYKIVRLRGIVLLVGQDRTLELRHEDARIEAGDGEPLCLG